MWPGIGRGKDLHTSLTAHVIGPVLLPSHDDWWSSFPQRTVGVLRMIAIGDRHEWLIWILSSPNRY